MTIAELRRDYDGGDEQEARAAFALDRPLMEAAGYLVSAERGGELRIPRPWDKWIGLFGLGALLGSMTRGEQIFYRHHVVYLLVADLPRDRNGKLLPITRDGRCPFCDRLTFQLPRPPFERYCHECETEFAA